MISTFNHQRFAHHLPELSPDSCVIVCSVFSPAYVPYLTTIHMEVTQ